MENLQEVKELFDLINIFNIAIPDGAEESLEVNGTKIILNKKDGVISISVTSDNEDAVEGFDDSYIKEIIKEYKERIEELDDCLFVEAAEEMGQHFDVKRFDELLNQDTFTEEEAAEVSEMIDQSSQIICDHLEDKINELVDVYNRF